MDMKPETLLKLSHPYTLIQAKMQRDKWIEIYRMIAIEHPSVEELADKLIQRVIDAYSLLKNPSVKIELTDDKGQ